MFKFFKFLIFFMAILYADSGFYNKALEYEKQGDILNAMMYYKKAFEARQAEEQIKDNSSLNLDKTDENDSYIDDILGLKTHNLNYLMPATYSTKVPDNRSKFETKFAFSVKKPLFYDFFGLKESFNIAYSQTSWWQTSRESMPFRESNYRPEVFINFDLDTALKDARIGFLHESNGQGGARSKSWNRIYTQVTFQNQKLSIIPRIWMPVGNLSDNKDITNYAGYADVRAKYNYKKHIFELILRNNLHFNSTNRGAAEFRWLFPTFSDGFYGYMSYFNGYAENLMDYDKHTNKIGIGFAVLR